MKNLLFLFVMLAFLVACSDDNDKSTTNKYGQFLIEKIVCSGGSDMVWEFTYNSKNELTKMTLPGGGAYGFDRNGSKLTMTCWEGDEEKRVVGYGILNENECLVSMQMEEDTYTFIYDASNRLISIADIPYVWEGNNMQSTTDGYYCDFVFEYTEYRNNINIDFIYIFNEIMCGFFSGNVGRPNQNLIKSYTVGEYKYELEYELDGEKVSVVREYYVRDGERELECTYRLYYK